MPELKKPDMPAVLERTNLAKHFGGFLLPAFEAISNSIHSIVDRYGESKLASQGKIRIKVRDSRTHDKFVMEIADNGAGLDEDNYDAFQTPFTGNKLRKNGKGFGRFIAFKVFENIWYYSRPANGSAKRSFKFDIYQPEEIIEVTTARDLPYETGCVVRYQSIKKEYENQFLKLDSENFLDAVTQNFLPQLVAGKMPETTVDYDGVVTDLRDHFLAVFQFQKTLPFSVSINDQAKEFSVSVSRVNRGAPFANHSLLFFADDRILGKARRIDAKLGRPFFERTDGSQYVIAAGVSGTYLDENANNDRTFLEVAEDDIKLIVDGACEAILEVENAQHELIKTDQRGNVLALLQRHPLLRFGLDGKTIDQYVASKPNGWSTERFVSDLAIQRHRAENRWSSILESAQESDEVFSDRKADLLSRISEYYRDALSEYVVHRKAVLELAARLRQFDDDSKMQPEDALHELIFPRNNDSVSKKYYQHNLWLLDERLAFTSYVSSDRTLHGGRRKEGDRVADINFYDEVFVAGGEGTSAVMMVEFKRPGRNTYSFGRQGDDPIKQVRETVAKIRERGSFVTTAGATITIPRSHEVAAFIVADLEPNLRSLAEEYDFTVSWDEKTLFHYHKSYNLYVEIFGYDKLLEDAEKRNGPFFDVLMQENG